MLRAIRIVAALLMTLSMLTPALADDWPQWLGPDRASEWRETGVVTELADGEQLPTKWRAPCSYGYAGPAVADGKVYLFDYVVASGDVTNNPGRPVKLTGRERLHCLDAKTGDAIWTNASDVEYYVSYPGGPRATPTVDGQHVFTLGTEGDLTCRAVDSGEPVWHVNFKEQFGTKTPIWGHASSPLVVGDLVVSLVGGEGSAVVAFNKHSGEVAWRALSSSEPGYSSPIAMDRDGATQVMAFYPTGVSALDAKTGKEIWTKSIQSKFGMSIAPPRLRGDKMFVSGYGESMMLGDARTDSPTALWRGKPTSSVDCTNVPPYFAEGVIIGCDAESSNLVAVDPETADRLWETPQPTVGPDADRRTRHGTAFIVRHTPSGRYVLFNESGELIFADLTREKYSEHGRTKLLEPSNEAFGRPVVWTHPAFAERCVFARNDNEIVCASLAE